MKLRQLEARDCQFILPIVKVWWGGRDVTHLFPRFLFDHFTDTSNN